MSFLKGILLVDDDKTTNFYNRFVIESNKLAENVYEALTAQEALDFLIHNKGRIDLILLDLNMPMLNGFEFIDRFRSQGFNSDKIKIFMLTSSNHKLDMDMIKEYGVSEYYEKPLDGGKLLKAIEKGAA